MKTKLTAKTLAILTCAVMVIAAFAAVAVARAELCPLCGGRITTKKTGYYGDEFDHYIRCDMIYSAVDEQWVKYRDTIYTCSTEGCPETYTETEKVYYRVCTHVAPK